MGYASSNLGQMRELWFKWGTRWELGEHNWKVVGTCWEMHHGEHGANIKIQKMLNFGPPPSLTPKGKIIIIIIIMGPLGVHVKELSHWLHENSIPKSVFVTIFWLGLVLLSSKEHDLGLM